MPPESLLLIERQVSQLHHAGFDTGQEDLRRRGPSQQRSQRRLTNARRHRLRPSDQFHAEAFGIAARQPAQQPGGELRSRLRRHQLQQFRDDVVIVALQFDNLRYRRQSVVEFRIVVFSGPDQNLYDLANVFLQFLAAPLRTQPHQQPLRRIRNRTQHSNQRLILIGRQRNRMIPRPATVQAGEHRLNELR